MRKLISLFSAISLLSSTSSMVVACGPGPGTEMKIVFNNPPQKQTTDTDPQVDYVYNDNYEYSQDSLTQSFTVLAQLGANKVRFNKNDFINDGNEIAKEFYKSESYKSKYYESFNYNDYGNNSLKKPFSTTDKNGTPLISGLTDNDKRKPLHSMYWFVTYASAAEAEKPQPEHTTSIEQPKVSDFKDKKKETITKTGWIPLFLKMNDAKTGITYAIDFVIRIDINFILHVDKNNVAIVVVDRSTIDNPVGQVDFYHPEYTFNDHDGKEGRIKNMTFRKI